MWFIVKILWTNYMWFIVKILWTWNLFFTLLEISKPLFFFPFLTIPLSQLLKKKKIYSPISAMTLPLLPFFFFNFKSTQLPKFNIFYLCFLVILSPLSCFFVILSPLSYFLVILSPLSCFLAEFRYLYSLSCFFGWISATPLSKFSLSPQFPN